MPPTSADRLREMAAYERVMVRWHAETAPDRSRAHEHRSAALLAGAEALEAWEWVMERKVTIQLNNGSWLCGSMSGYGVADTPLGAVLAAMGEDKDGSDE